MHEAEIWDYLLAFIRNEYGAAGMMGNLYAESALNFGDLEGRAAKKLGMTDLEYTLAVDCGKYTQEQFMLDGAGYGIAQWTYSSRKKHLYEATVRSGKSVADAHEQMHYLICELDVSFPGVLAALRNAKSVREASDAVLHGFEKPKNQSEEVEEKRAGYARKFYEKYAEGGGRVATIKRDAIIADFQHMLDGKWGYIFGTSGQILTEAEYQKKAEKYPMAKKYGKKWIGHHVADCSGAFVWAYRQHGQSIYHGVNRIAREYVVELLPVSAAEPGMAAFKTYEPGDKLYDLPDEFKPGHSHYNGDLKDYHHIGLVDKDPAHVLESATTYIGVRRGDLKDNWTYVARLKAVDYDGGDLPVAILYKAIVDSANDKPVNLRKGPNVNSARIAEIPDGTLVDVLNETNEEWAEIRCGEKQGYMMRRFLVKQDDVPDDDGREALILALRQIRDIADQALKNAGEG